MHSGSVGPNRRRLRRKQRSTSNHGKRTQTGRCTEGCRTSIRGGLLKNQKKRLARILSLLAHFDRHGSAVADIPNVNQETLAEMVGTTRSRVSLFMNRFRQSGFVDYKPGSTMIRVHRTILAFYASG
jgi:CRP-like cAMP-binding protein